MSSPSTFTVGIIREEEGNAVLLGESAISGETPDAASCGSKIFSAANSARSRKPDAANGQGRLRRAVVFTVLGALKYQCKACATALKKS